LPPTEVARPCAALDHFIEGFPTSAGLLKQIKREFETALDRVIVFARDNVQLREKRSADKAVRRAAVDNAYHKVPSCLRPLLQCASTAACPPTGLWDVRNTSMYTCASRCFMSDFGCS
jgi:hypothetical protein